MHGLRRRNALRCTALAGAQQKGRSVSGLVLCWLRRSVEEQRNQDDDGDWHANQPKQDGSHGVSFLGLPAGKVGVQMKSMVSQASRWRPPKVADRLPTKAPISSTTNIHISE